MKILLLDNYDSFTYNLLHVVKELGYTDIEVFRNDRINLDEVNRFDKIILSPGPGIPAEAGLLLPIIKQKTASKNVYASSNFTEIISYSVLRSYKHLTPMVNEDIPF